MKALRPWLLGLALLSLPAAADDARVELDIRPTTVTLDDGTGHAELWLHNRSRGIWRGQAMVLRWEQQGQGEQLLPADDLVVSPALLVIPAGQGQRLRLVRPQPAPADGQRAYRLLLTPVAAEGTGQVRYSLPVFSQVAESTAPVQLQVALGENAGEGTPLLRLYNRGDRGVQLADLSFVDARGRRQMLIQGLAGYVLAHRERSWPLPEAGRQRYADGRFHARLDGAASAALPVAEPAFAAPPPHGL